MGYSRVPTLPVELLIDVASNLTKIDLCSFALVNVHCNYAATSFLYADITLDNPYDTRKCLDSLNRTSTLCSFQRTLPSLIRSFVIDWGAWYTEEDKDKDKALTSDMLMLNNSDLQAEFCMPTPRGVPRNGLRPALENAMLHMHNLQRFACWESFMFTPNTLACLVTSPAARSLQELGATLEDWRLPPYRLSLDGILPTCTRLRKVHFILPRRQVDWDSCIGYIGNLLKTSATHIESLALDLSSSYTVLHASELFSRINCLPSLEVLRLPTATDLPSIPRAHGLQCLWLNCQYSRIGRDGITGRRTLSSSLHPRLERLYCSHADLPAFLPADTDTRRPIHAVFLDEATYDLNGGIGYSRAPLSLLHNPSTALKETLKSLSNSGVPVTELNLYLDYLNVAKLFQILPYVEHLEQFVVVTKHPPKRLKEAHLLGKNMFAYMPRLHTFLLCPSVRVCTRSTWMHDRRGGYFYERQERCLRAFDKHAPWLRRVMFTAGLEWVKKVNGTWDVVEGEVF